MTPLLQNSLSALPPLTRASNVQLVAAGALLWRIVDRSGRVIGHLQAMREGSDIRYRARRFHAQSRAFRDLGEFWSIDDAVECVLFTR
jgi:hypothetical protein